MNIRKLHISKSNLFLFSLLYLLLFGCTISEPSNSKDDSNLPKLSVGIQNSPAMTLVMCAEDQGFFDSAGVNVELKEFTAGKFALQAFLGGSLDVAISGEVPVTLATLQGNEFRVITQVVERTINECRVVVRKELGLDTPDAYFKAKKRKLSTSFGGGPEFFTYNFLKRYNIPEEQIELISQNPEDMPAALISGSVDAIAIFDPFARIAEVNLDTQAMTFSDETIYSELYVANVMQETIDEKPQLLKAFLQGLYDASFFVKNNEPEAKQVLIKYTKLDMQIVNDIWDNFVFKPAINNLFVNYTTEQARWAIEKGAFPEGTQIPDYRAILFTEFLEKIDSNAVNLRK